MINNDRIVPIQKIDLLSMYGTILNLAGVKPDVLEASTIDGSFTVDTSDGVFLANQPVQNLDFADGVTSAEVYFVAAYDYAGMSVAGSAVEPDGDAINPDGVTLYYAELSDGAVSIAAITPVLA